MKYQTCSTIKENLNNEAQELLVGLQSLLTVFGLKVPFFSQ